MSASAKNSRSNSKMNSRMNSERELREWKEAEAEASEEPKESKLLIISRLFFAIFWIYVFIFSIGLMSDSFQVLGGSFLNKMLDQVQDHLNIPYCGLCLGLLLTALCQSSSTSTAIFITLVAADLFTVSQGIYCIMGANVGTSITSTLVAFGNIATPTEFRNSMACAALPAMFNWLTVLALLPLEMNFSMLEKITAAATQNLVQNGTEPGDSGGHGKSPIKAITKPIQQFIISIDKHGLGNSNYSGTFVKYCHERVEKCENFCDYGDECSDLEGGEKACMQISDEFECEWNGNNRTTTWDYFYGENCVEKECHMFIDLCWSDEVVGGICLTLAFVLMFLSLGGVVKCLKAVLEGSITDMIHKHIDRNLPHPFGWLTEYLYVLVGLVLTMAVQSSSIILAIMTPIVGIGVISIERCYPLTVGSKLGTTITGVIAAFANAGAGFRPALQVSMSHTLFNVFGMIFFFLVPITRRLPICLAKFCGVEAGKYRWWAFMYTASMFFIIPVGLFAISVISVPAATVVLAVTIGTATFVACVNQARDSRPQYVPKKLHSWKWLPVWCRSLEPYDRYMCGRFSKRSRSLSSSNIEEAPLDPVSKTS